MTVSEFEKELELFRQHKDPLCRYQNPLIGIYQFHFITRADDVCNFKLDDPKSHPNYDFALAQSVQWSKNVRDSRNCPDQLLLASMDYKSYIFVAMAVWLE
jgi:DNA phosphorothioation-dependent restriction protein DptG